MVGRAVFSVGVEWCVDAEIGAEGSPIDKWDPSYSLGGPQIPPVGGITAKSKDMLLRIPELCKSMEEGVIDPGVVKRSENRKSKRFQFGPRFSIQALHDR